MVAGRDEHRRRRSGAWRAPRRRWCTALPAAPSSGRRRPPTIARSSGEPSHRLPRRGRKAGCRRRARFAPAPARRERPSGFRRSASGTWRPRRPRPRPGRSRPRSPASTTASNRHQCPPGARQGAGRLSAPSSSPLVDAIALVGVAADRLDDAAHAGVVLEDPGELDLLDSELARPRLRGGDHEERERGTEARALKFAPHAHQRHARGGRVAHLESPQELRPAEGQRAGHRARESPR